MYAVRRRVDIFRSFGSPVQSWGEFRFRRGFPEAACRVDLLCVFPGVIRVLGLGGNRVSHHYVFSSSVRFPAHTHSRVFFDPDRCPAGEPSRCRTQVYEPSAVPTGTAQDFVTDSTGPVGCVLHATHIPGATHGSQSSFPVHVRHRFQPLQRPRVDRLRQQNLRQHGLLHRCFRDSGNGSPGAEQCRMESRCRKRRLLPDRFELRHIPGHSRLRDSRDLRAGPPTTATAPTR